MKVTYLNHSGFLLEWDKCYWLFDYYKGEIPRLDGRKELFVFCSHSHGDHFNPAVFELAEKYPRVTYLFANEVRQAYKKLSRKNGKKLPEARFLHVGSDVEVPVREMLTVPGAEEGERGAGKNAGLGETAVPGEKAEGRMRIHTLHSTDCGGAFVLEYEGKRVYHAGDLHWWTWPGESEEENRKMAADYRKEMEYLKGHRIDLAFTPLDPRQEQDYALGMNYFLQNIEVKHVFPMHFWDDFSIMEKYQRENPVKPGIVFHAISRDGQSWELGRI